MQFFLAGIMQGSHTESVIHDQDYRSRLRTIIERNFPGAIVYDPLADHGQSLDYDDATGRTVFYNHNRMCREVDVVIAYVPEASMGTAIEIWEAYEHGRGAVVTISPLKENWAIKYSSHMIYSDLSSFEKSVVQGDFAQLLADTVRNRVP